MTKAEKNIQEKIDYLNELGIKFELNENVALAKWIDKYGKGGMYKVKELNAIICTDNPFQVDLISTPIDCLKSSIERWVV